VGGDGKCFWEEGGSPAGRDAIRYSRARRVLYGLVVWGECLVGKAKEAEANSSNGVAQTNTTKTSAKERLLCT